MKKRSMKPRHKPSISEIRERAWQRLRAAVPLALRAVAEDKAELEARIDAGKKLSPRDRRELEDIRARIHALRPAELAVLRRALKFIETGEREQPPEPNKGIEKGDPT